MKDADTLFGCRTADVSSLSLKPRAFFVGILLFCVLFLTASIAGALEVRPQVTTGYGFAAVIKADGTLWTWGLNNVGQLGDGSLFNRPSPVQIGTVNKWVSVEAGALHAAALKSDGTLWTWGGNTYGQLGDGTTVDRTSPVQIGADTKWVSVEGGANHTVALKSDGTLWAWGHNYNGQLGDGTTVDKTTPVQIGTDNKWISVAAGGVHTIALKSDGTLWAWGANANGQLGDGTTVSKSAPVQIGTDNKWAFVKGGNQHTVALKSDGTLWTWGRNHYGQLGDGTVIDKNTPVQIGSDNKWIAVFGGEGYQTYTAAIKSDGTVWTWGSNCWGQLGDGTTADKTLPAQIMQTGGDSWTKVAPGGSHAIAVKSDGTLWAWGDNISGQLGVGNNTGPQTCGAGFACSKWPVQAGTDNKWVSISTGLNHSAALKSDGKLWTWGQNNYGQLGDATTVDKSSPLQIGTATDWVSISAGDSHTVALKSNGTLWAWGDNLNGTLGIGNNTGPQTCATDACSTSPVQIGTDNKWVSFAAGGHHTAALKSDGTLWTWGDNAWGQLGDGTTTHKYSPTQIGIDDKWASLAAGYGHTMALKSDGTLWAWGDNKYGQLGDGTTVDKYIPTQIGTDDKWVSVDAGHFYTVALKSDGTLWAWGDNNHGQLGDGTTLSKSAPVQIGADNNWIAVTAGDYHTLALKSDGTLWTWGENEWGQLGDGTVADKSSPISAGDSTAPTGSISINTGAAYTNTTSVTLRLVCSDGTGSGCLEMKFSNDGITYSAAVAYAPKSGYDTAAWTLATGDGTKTVYAMFKDTGGNWSIAYTDTIILDSSGPVTSASPAGGAYASSQSVTLNCDDGTGLGCAAIHYTTNGTEPTAASTVYSSPISITASTTLKFFALDNAGNSGAVNTETYDIVILVPSSSVKQVSSGQYHTVAVRSDGTLWSWGYNGNGQLGNGTTTNSLTPIKIGTDTNWVSVSAGHQHNAALRSDGALWVWGFNNAGQLGNGTTTNSLTPVRIGTDTKWVSVAAGDFHTMAVKSDGTLWGWGLNGNGQLGTGTTTSSLTPVKIGIDTDWVSVAAGNSHTVALKADGTLWTWGMNFYGQLGNGNTTDELSPGQRGTDTKWVSVAAGQAHTVALKSDGTLWGWGHNNSGQLGDGTNADRTVPVQTGTDNKWVSATAGLTYSAALKSDGTLWAWGGNANGQVGDGTTVNKNSPTKIGADRDWIYVEAGASHGTAIKSDGMLWSWGYNANGQLGDGTTTGKTAPYPIIRSDGNDWSTASTGTYHAAAIKSDGTLWAWGWNGHGQLGDGTTVDKTTPVRIGTDTTWVSVDAEYYSTAAIKSDGTLWAWGWNGYGQLGDGTTVDKTTPVRIGTDENWVSVFLGPFHSVGLKSDGTLWAWGYNMMGQLGNGTTVDEVSPIQIGTDNKWVSVAAGEGHTVALKSDGSLWTWGFNYYGQLGDGTTVGKTSPFQIAAGTKWISVTCGFDEIFAIKSDGTLWAWGRNDRGQLGDSTTVNKSVPTQIGTDTNWVSVSAGAHTVGLKSDGTLWTWGENNFGQLGDTTPGYRTEPLQIGTDTNWVSAAAGDYHTLAIKAEGTLWAWGFNGYGQLGDGTTIDRTSPARTGEDFTAPSGTITVNSGAAYTNSLSVTLSLSCDDGLGTGCAEMQLSNDDVTYSTPEAFAGTKTWSLAAGEGTKTIYVKFSDMNGNWSSAYSDTIVLDTAAPTTTASPGGSYFLTSQNITLACSDSGSGCANIYYTTNGSTPTTASPVYATPISITATTALKFFAKDTAGNSEAVKTGTYNMVSIVPSNGVKQVSSGQDHTVAIRSDGTLWAWGYNGHGELGDGTTANKTSPVQTGTDNKWVSVSAGNYHNMAIKSDGTLWAWGSNGFGQLGDGTTANKTSPVQIGADTKWVSVSSGYDHTMALKSDGTLWAWGWNVYGQLGDGTTTNKTSPVQIGTDTKWVSVSTGMFYSMAVKSDGTLWAWGSNGFGQLGDGTTVNRTSPVQIGADTKWVSASSGYDHTMALKSDGTLWAWGWNAYGQLGDGTTTNKTSPVQIGTDTKWVSASSGYDHSAALKSDGTLWEWGRNAYGQLGDVTTVNKTSPVQIGLDNKSVFVEAGYYFTLAIKSDGTLWAWGNNTYGQLGDGTTTGKTAPYPIILSDGSDWNMAAASGSHTTALKSDGTLWSWGWNAYGQLGDGTTVSKSAPVQVGTDNKWVYIDSENLNTVALKSDGTLWTWGYNPFGQLGDGTTVNKPSPVQVGTDNTWASASMGTIHAMGLKSDGTLWAWGRNEYGQLGNGTTTDSLIPVQVGADTKWVSAVVGAYHTLGLKSDGTLWGWGNNGSGQLGTGNYAGSQTPVQIGADRKWVSVSAGYDYSIALKSDGTLWAWGFNIYGQLGDGTTASKTSPVQVGTDNKWVSVAAGQQHVVAIKSDGTLWAWGDNSLGQLGDGTTVNKPSPVRIGTDTTWVSVSAGSYHTVAIKSDGTIWAWGRNSTSQLGDGSTVNKTSPVLAGADSSAPVGTVIINAGALFTNSLSATLGLSCDDGLGTGCAEMQLSNDDVTYSTQEAFAGTKTWSLTAGEGTKTVYVKFSDMNGNWSSAYSDTIVLDTAAPVTTASPSGSSFVLAQSIALSCSDTGGSGCANIYYTTNGSTPTTASPVYSTPISITATTTLKFFAKDTAGNSEAVNTETYNMVSIVPSSGVKQVSAGSNHTAVIRSDGTLWTSGYNGYGQLGDGTTADKYSPTHIGLDNKWVSVAAGYGHTVALKSDGTLWAWGANYSGQLGDGTTGNKNSPVRIGTDTKWVSVAAGNAYTVALKSDGTLWAWGWNAYGQMGDGTTADKTSPVQIGTDNKWVSIEVGELHTMALKSDGTLWAWGWNYHGQLGDGTTVNKTSPVQIGTDTKWVSVSAGTAHTVAVKSDGTLWTWGNNYSGQLGDGTTVNKTSPVQIGTDTKWVFVSAGNVHSAALKSDGSLLTWGYNVDGRLGDGTTTDRFSPYPIIQSDGKEWSRAVAGGYQTMAIKSDGTLWGAGRNDLGQLGDGTTVNKTALVEIGTDTKWMSSAVGSSHIASVKSDGTLWAWGYNNYGQLGDGSTGSYRTTPVQIGADANWVSVAVGAYHTVALKSDGTLWAWGYNFAGQLGIGNTTDKNSPVQIGTDTNWVSVDAGAYNTMAIKSDGTLWAWGYNYYYQLGDGTQTSRLSPVQIGADSKWVSVSAGVEYTLAVKSDGTLWAWGSNDYGQLGNGTTTTGMSPVQIGSDTKWVSVSAGGAGHTMALKSDGTLWAWGKNYFGQLGIGNNTGPDTCSGLSCSKSPLQVGVDSDWISVSAGDLHTVAIKADGSLWSWGYNGYGQLADGTTTDKTTPAEVDTTPPSGTITINSGANFTNSASVSLALTCSDALSGCAGMKFSNDGITYSAAEAYFASKTWVLAAGDGVKTVYVKFKDTAGNWSAAVTDAIVLDTTPPARPGNIDVRQNGVKGELLVSWTRPAASEYSHFHIYRSTSAGTLGSLIADNLTGLMFTDNGLASSTTYYYTVRAVDMAGNESTNTNDQPNEYGKFPFATTLDSAPPAVPANITATDAASGGTINLLWTNPTDADFSHIHIYRSESAGVLGLLVYDNVTASSRSDTGLTNGKTYYYTIRAIDSSGNETTNTVQASATPTAPDTTAPGAVSGVTISNPATGGTLNLAWTNPTDPDFSKVRIYRSTISGQIGTQVYEVAAAVLSDTGLTDNTTYYYTFHTVDALGNESTHGTQYSGMPTDTVAPDPISGLTATLLLGANVRLDWLISPSPDANYYNIYYDNGTGTIDYGTPLASVAHPTAIWNSLNGTLTAGVRYQFAVRTEDTSINEETNTTMVVSIVPVSDPNAGPVSAGISTPKTGRRVHGNSLTVAASLVMGLISNVQEIRFQYKSVSSGTWLDIPSADPNPDTASPFNIHWDLTAVADGDYNLKAVATAKTSPPGTDANPPYITITVDSANPQVTENLTGGVRVVLEKLKITSGGMIKSAGSGVTEVSIPGDALSADTWLTLTKHDPAVKSSLVPTGYGNAKEFREVTFASGQTVLSNGKKAGIKIPYWDVNNDGIVDGTSVRVYDLQICLYDSSAVRWDCLDSVVDGGSKSVRAKSEKVGLFALLAPPKPLGANWNMLSVPLQPSPNTPSAVFGSVTSYPGYVNRWNPSTGSYNSVSSISAGESYWVWGNGNNMGSVSGTETTDANFSIPLLRGWNMIGHPFRYMVRVSDLWVYYQSNYYTIEEAEANGWVVASVYKFDGGAYYAQSAQDAGVLEAWKGYWLLSDVDCTLVVPPSPVQ